MTALTVSLYDPSSANCRIFNIYFIFQKRDESGVNTSCREWNLCFLLASSFYWNHVFNVHQWLVSIL